MFTANNLPASVRSLPAFAVAPFMEAANRAIGAGVPEHEAERVGLAVARQAIEMEQPDVLRADGDGARVRRMDHVGLRLDASTVVHLPNGMVDVWGVATRTGVLEYDEPGGGIFLEYRPPEEVFAPESLGSLVGVAFTILHPDDPVTTANARDLTHGWVLAVEQRGSEVWVRVRIATDEALAAIRDDGLVELSCGYTARLELLEGVSPDGEPFHAIQRDIRYNHLALVEMARAGAVARLHFDGARIQRAHSHGETDPMQKFTIRFDGKAAKAPMWILAALKGAAVKTDGTGHRNGYHRDLKTGRVAIEVEGEEPAELVLPLSMIEEMMGMIGAPLASEAPPAPEAPESSEDQEGEPMASGPAAPPPPPMEEDGDRRMDAAKVQAMIGEAIAAERKRHDAAARHRAGVERNASRVLDAGYNYDAADAPGIQAATVAHVMEDRKDEAAELATRVRKGDERAAGKLDALFSFACDAARAESQARADAASMPSETGAPGQPTGDLIMDSRAKFLARMNKGSEASA